jgi:hypothetical protein
MATRRVLLEIRSRDGLRASLRRIFSKSVLCGLSREHSQTYTVTYAFHTRAVTVVVGDEIAVAVTSVTGIGPTAVGATNSLQNVV